MAAGQQNSSGIIGERVKGVIKKQLWKLLIEIIPFVGDISPTFCLIVYSELKRRDKLASAEGVMMLSVAVLWDASGYGCVALDTALGSGFLVSPFVAVSGYCIVVPWLIFTGGSPIPKPGMKPGQKIGPGARPDVPKQ